MKIRRSIRGSLFLMGACLLTGMGAWAQASSAVQQSQVSTDLAVTYSLERSELAPGDCGCFWLQGGGVDAAVTFWKGLGVAASFTGGHAANIAPGVDLNKIAFAAGPRFTYNAWTGHAAATDQRRLQIFGQGLFGGVHGFDGLYPVTSGVTSSAGSLAIEAGGGVNLFLTKNLGVRLLEAEYVRTELPNNASNTQNDMRLSFGFAYHLSARRRR